MKKLAFWVLFALAVFVGFLVHKDTTSAQSELGTFGRISPEAPSAAFTSGNLVVYRVGDGVAALSSAATPSFLDEFTTAAAQAGPVQSLAVPTVVSGVNHALTSSGTSGAEGLMTRSVDGKYLVFSGYDAPVGTASITTSSSTTVNRVIGRSDASGNIDTSTSLTDAISGGNPRGAASTDGTNLWISGTSSGGGIRYAVLSATTSTQIASTPTNFRAVEIFNGQLYVSSATTTFQGVSMVGTGTPTTTGQTVTLLNGFPTTTGPSPYQFIFFNPSTLYVCDDRAIASGGGIQKWTLGGGTWTLAGTLSNGFSAGCRGLTFTTNGLSQPVLYATTAESSANKLISVVDDGTAFPGAAATVLATAAANTAFRGVALAPAGAAAPAPAVTSVSPTSGSTSGGTSVTITGTNFTGATAVSFGGTPATTFTVNSATSITATAPAHAAGTVDVTVTTSGGTSAISASDHYTYNAPTPAPAVTNVSPTSGTTGGGTSVTIAGTNFTGATAVSFGGTAATSFTVNSATSITATSPAHAAGTVDITVTTTGGTSATSASDQFTFNAPIPAPSVTGVSPTSGSTSGGTSVVITGSNFTGATAVSFGGTAATSFTVNSATQITATAPAHAAGTVDVTVTTSGGTSAISASDHYTYNAPTPAPTVTSVSPTSGTTSGGTSVTITGTNFTGATAVSFGGTPATSFTVNSATSITATSPAHAAGTVDVTVTTPGGTSATSASDQFTYTAAGPPPHVQHIVDYDGDGITDLAIIRDPSAGTDPNAAAQWWALPSANPSNALVKQWGFSSDQFLAGDYDGDHHTDFVIWRQADTANGVHAAFWILHSLDGTVDVENFGQNGDSPFVVGDYDGDGKDDVAIYRGDPNGVDPNVHAEWWFRPSGGILKGKDVPVQWGSQMDFPIPGDYNGDGKADMAIGKVNPDQSVTVWIHDGDGTSNSSTVTTIVPWGLSSDQYVPGDYDGDGFTDLAIVRNDGIHLEWWVRWSSDKSVHVAKWGAPGDLLWTAQGDYDGDGKTDIAIWRPSEGNFYIIGSQKGAPIIRQWGDPTTDAPVANYNEH
ncbi:MAG: IPT/TIG domain-containing protein [Pyrinomonadaceae bacterium]